MSDPFIGEIWMAGFSFAPVDWLPCDGRTLNISDYQDLYNVIGAAYGGDGQNTFALPDFRGRLPISNGTNAGSNYSIGQQFGTETVTLNGNQVGQHNHVFTGSLGGTPQESPENAYLAGTETTFSYYTPDTTNLTGLASSSILPFGGNGPHNNIMPYRCVNFVISTAGVSPSAS